MKLRRLVQVKLQERLVTDMYVCEGSRVCVMYTNVQGECVGVCVHPLVDHRPA